MPKRRDSSTDIFFYFKACFSSAVLLYLVFLYLEGYRHGAARRSQKEDFALRCKQFESVRAENPYGCEEARMLPFYFEAESGFTHLGNVLTGKLQAIGWMAGVAILALFAASYFLRQFSRYGDQMNELAYLVRRQSGGVCIEEIEDGEEFGKRRAIAYN
jgi:hypothetical protein